jgi:glutathione S-transferase
MAELEIVGGAPSNYVWVCRIACAEKGVPYRHVEAMPHSPEVDAIHPLGRIPVMRHGNVTLAESRAICFYIDSAFDGPPLVPSDLVPAAQVEQWVSLVNTGIDPVWLRQYLASYVFPGTPDNSPNRAAIDAALPKMEQQFTIMDRAVARGHLVGDTFTLADVNLIPLLYYMTKLPESAALLQKMSNLKAYFERHFARRSVQHALPPWLPGRLGQQQSDVTRAA